MPPIKRKMTLFSLTRPILLAVGLILAVPLSAGAKTLGFRTVFGSNMVLPHGRPVILSGYASPDSALALEVDAKSYSFRSDSEGQWRTEVAPLPAIVSMDTDTVALDFSPPIQMSDTEKEVAGFSLCPEVESDCVYTKASQTGSRIIVSLDALENAGRLRYCWSDGGQCELKAINDLSVSSFELKLPRE